MDTFLSVGFLAGALAGFVFGAAFATARIAWRGYQTTKASVPGLRRTAWALVGAAFSKGGLVVALGVAAVALAIYNPG